MAYEKFEAHVLLPGEIVNILVNLQTLQDFFQKNTGPWLP